MMERGTIFLFLFSGPTACAIALSAACGSSGDDALTADGGGDAVTRDAHTDALADAARSDGGLVTVHAANALGPLAGAVVVFYDPTGIPYPPVTTTADGTATGIVPAGSSVTISILTTEAPGDLQYELTTFESIEPWARSRSSSRRLAQSEWRRSIRPRG
jgi:hypothetical protein